MMCELNHIDQVAQAGGGEKGFLERTVNSLLAATEHSLVAEGLASSPGLLQGIDPRVKVVGLFALILAAILAHRLAVVACVFGIGVVLALFSAIDLRYFAVRVWAGALAFSGVIAIPSFFLTPGQLILRIPYLRWTVSRQGLTAGAFLVSRVEAAVTLSTLLILCTPWTHVMKALRVLGVPSLFVVMLSMTYRFVFVLLKTASDMLESRRSRMVGSLSGAEQRRLAAATVGVLLSKSMHLSSEIYLAMLSRGFRGEAYSLADFQMKRRDWGALAAFLCAAATAVWLGR